MIGFHNTGFAYGSGEIFADISLTLDPGSFHFLTGPSGAGKSTFLNLCSLLLMPTSGRVEIFGNDASTLDRDAIADMRRRIGIVHQDCAFLDHLSLAQNIALPITLAGGDARARRGEIADLLDWVELGRRADAYPPELSGGERQRAALARAVILTPDIILADEPTGNVDWEMGEKVMTLLIELNKLGKSVLIATHDLTLIRSVRQQVTARVLRLKGGEMIQAGSDL